MKKLIGLLLLPLGVFAQDIEPIECDRPDQTETPSLVPKGMFQMETGFSVEKDKSDQALALPSALLKYGVNDRFELRLIVGYGNFRADGVTTSGIEPVLIGTKISLCEEDGFIPKTSFIGHVSIPNLSSPQLKADHYAPEFRLTMAHTLSDKISLSYNLGAEWDGFTPDATFAYTLTTGFSMTQKFGAYVEVFGFAPEHDSASHSADGGFTFLLSNNAMIDISGGFGLTENAPDYYGALGFSFRI